MKKNLLLFLSICCFTINAFGQLDFYNNLIINQDFSVKEASSVLLTDIDGDTDLDVVSSSYFGSRIAWQENIDGQGNYGNIKIITENASEVRSLFDIDIDGDGDIDLISASYEDGKIAWYENDGQGNFSNQNIIIDDAGGAQSVFGSDVDNDGDVDIVASIGCCVITWFENLDGEGNFGTRNDIVGMFLASPTSIYVEDMDGDGDMDVVANSLREDYFIKIVWFENTDGLGSFGDQQDIHTFTPELNYSVISQVNSSDVDGDGDNDIIYTANNQLGWIENTDGFGDFTSISPHIIKQNYTRNRFLDIKTKDMDNDGDLDVISGGTEWQDPERITWYQNLDGLGNFATGFGNYTFSNETDGIKSIDVGDINNDGFIDVVSSSSSSDANVSWYKNSGDNLDFGNPLSISKYWYSPNNSRLIDLDNDNDLDIVNKVGDALVWYKNLDGLGNFSNQIVINIEISGNLEFSDINGDGNIDIVGSYATNLMWIENFGDGTFSTKNVIEVNPSVNSNAYTGDIDGDGDMDLISTNKPYSNSNYIGYNENLDGLGNFGPFQTIINLGSNNLNNLEIKDFDGDNDNDIVFTGSDGTGNAGQIGWIKNSDGLGSFGPKIVIHNDEANALYAVDMDGDNDLDLVTGTYSDDIIAWFENTDGIGNFSSRKIISQTNNFNGATSVHAADLDNDGDQDVISTSRYGSNVAWYENIDSIGDFGSQNIITNGAEGANSAFPGDIDNDGKLDMVISASSGNHPVSWFKNSGLLSNRLNGNVFLDIDNDGCDFGDIRLSNLMVSATNGTETITTFTFNSGYYQMFPTQEGTYTTTIESNINYYNSSPDFVNSIFTGFENIEVADFCFTANQTINDLNIDIIPLGDARPGFTSSYSINYENVGTVTQNGNVIINFDDTKLSFISANQSVISQSSNQLTFNYNNLNPFESRNIIVLFQIFPPPTVNIDEVLTFTATVNPISGDITEEDNTIELNQVLIGSYDPNDISVLEGPQISIDNIDEYLHYVIRFQNTGTASAINVQVDNELDQDLDWNSLKLEYVSHNYFVEITNGNMVKFIFDNINLPDSTSDEPNSHGFIAYKIKPKNDVVVGDIFNNTADIFFDFNPAIVTNTVSTEIVDSTLSVEAFEISNISIYPNPTNTILNINSNTIFDSILVYDVNGRQLISKEIKEEKTSIEVSTLSQGLYFLEVKSGSSKEIIKFIKK